MTARQEIVTAAVAAGFTTDPGYPGPDGDPSAAWTGRLGEYGVHVEFSVRGGITYAGTALGSREWRQMNGRHRLGRVLDYLRRAQEEHARITAAAVAQDASGRPVFKIPDHNTDTGSWCRFSHCTTYRPDGWCPRRCVSIAPHPVGVPEPASLPTDAAYDFGTVQAKALRTAADDARRNKVTWLTDAGEPYAGIAPVDVIRAGLAALADRLNPSPKETP